MGNRAIQGGGVTNPSHGRAHQENIQAEKPRGNRDLVGII